jgi:undecaprenyl phosphate N,N'-diacetylbacillosamine 1-phosphate transferase
LYKLFFKRLIDIIGSASVLIILSPILTLVFLILYFSNNGKPFFTQTRPGLNEKLFRIIKFKTMNDKKDKFGKLLPDAERLTSIGSFIRKTSFDELPQLINVFVGDMSLIGPRPLLVQYLPLYNQIQRQRHHVKPGITGWAQVNGRNAISWKKKFDYDVFYVQNLSFWLDFKFVFLTVLKVFKREGISSDTSATMEVFTGN